MGKRGYSPCDTSTDGDIFTSTISTLRLGSFVSMRKESTRWLIQSSLLSFSAWIFTPLLTTVNILFAGILYSFNAVVYNPTKPCRVAEKVGSVKEIKSVLTEVSLMILKAPLL